MSGPRNTLNMRKRKSIEPMNCSLSISFRVLSRISRATLLWTMVGTDGKHSSRNTRMDAKTRSKEMLTPVADLLLIEGTSLLFVSTAGREAGSSESAFAFFTRTGKGTPRVASHRELHEDKESAEWPFGPRSGQESPTLGANPFIPKRKRLAFAERRSGDATLGRVKKIKGEGINH